MWCIGLGNLVDQVRCSFNGGSCSYWLKTFGSELHQHPFLAQKVYTCLCAERGQLGSQHGLGHYPRCTSGGTRPDCCYQLAWNSGFV